MLIAFNISFSSNCQKKKGENSEKGVELWLPGKKKPKEFRRLKRNNKGNQQHA